MAYQPLKFGTTTLVGGTKTITDSAIKATSSVFVTNNSVGGTIGIISVAIIANTSFTINSTNILDTSVINYLIIY